MRRNISWLVAGTTSAVVLGFVVPLCLLVRTAAEDRAVAAGSDEARSIATLVSGPFEDPAIGELVEQAGQHSRASTAVLQPDGSILGELVSDLAADPGIQRARTGNAFTEETRAGVRIYVPVVSAEGTSVVRTTVPSELMRAGVYRAWTALGLLGVGLLVLAMFIAGWLGRRISKPVTELAAVAQHLHEGNLEARAVPAGTRETVELAEIINRLAERIRELLAAERAAVGDLSHRLRTPVTALRLDAESVTERELADRLLQHIEVLQRTIDAIIRDARRPLASELGSSCEATAVVRERAAFWSALAEDQSRPVLLTLPQRRVVLGLDASDLIDMIDVLVDNVFAHTPDDVGFSIRLSDESDAVVVEVQDSGPGLMAGAEVGSGEGPRTGTTGLGLQIVRRTAARVGGQLTLMNTNRGLLAKITFPRPSASSQDPSW